jgi:hypothetical protein
MPAIVIASVTILAVPALLAEAAVAEPKISVLVVVLAISCRCEGRWITS